jgi:hypothetical protein
MAAIHRATLGDGDPDELDVENEADIDLGEPAGVRAGDDVDFGDGAGPEIHDEPDAGPGAVAVSPADDLVSVDAAVAAGPVEPAVAEPVAPPSRPAPRRRRGASRPAGPPASVAG